MKSSGRFGRYFCDSESVSGWFGGGGGGIAAAVVVVIDVGCEGATPAPAVALVVDVEGGGVAVVVVAPLCAPPCSPARASADVAASAAIVTPIKAFLMTSSFVHAFGG